MKGWIYIAANTHMPGLVKIGYTEKDPDDRAKELSSDTGVPGNTEIKYAAWVEDVITIERKLHERFDATRVPGKEWFEIEIGDAIDVLKTLCNPIFEDIRIPLVVVCCPKCGKGHRLPPNQEGTVRCKNNQCNCEFVTSTMSEEESGEREIAELRALLDRRTESDQRKIDELRVLLDRRAADYRELCNHPIIKYAIHLDESEEIVEIESDQLDIEDLRTVLDQQIDERHEATAKIVELKDFISEQEETIKELEEQGGNEGMAHVYVVCQNCGVFNEIDGEVVDGEIELDRTDCPSCGYNTIPLPPVLGD